MMFTKRSGGYPLARRPFRNGNSEGHQALSTGPVLVCNRVGAHPEQFLEILDRRVIRYVSPELHLSISPRKW